MYNISTRQMRQIPAPPPPSRRSPRPKISPPMVFKPSSTIWTQLPILHHRAFRQAWRDWAQLPRCIENRSSPLEGTPQFRQVLRDICTRQANKFPPRSWAPMHLSNQPMRATLYLAKGATPSRLAFQGRPLLWPFGPQPTPLVLGII